MGTAKLRPMAKNKKTDINALEIFFQPYKAAKRQTVNKQIQKTLKGHVFKQIIEQQRKIQKYEKNYTKHFNN